MPDQLVRASVIALYFLIVLSIGVVAYRRTGTGTEPLGAANRHLGPEAGQGSTRLSPCLACQPLPAL